MKILIEDDLKRPISVFIEPEEVMTTAPLWDPSRYRKVGANYPEWVAPERYALINGRILYYNFCSSNKNDYADLNVRCIGKGSVYEIGDVKQNGPHDYYFFVWN